MLKHPLLLQAIEKNAEPIARDLATQVLKPAAAAADSADPASKQFTEEGVKPAAKIIADNVQPVAQGFTDETLLPTAQKVRPTLIGLVYTQGSLSDLIQVNLNLEMLCLFTMPHGCCSPQCQASILFLYI